MSIERLDRNRELALLQEMESTRNLLAYGIDAIRRDVLFVNVREPILTLLSIGLEKLYKITLGIIALDRDNRWPSKPEMKKHGHNLVSMHQIVMRELRRRATTASNSYLQGLIAEAEDDSVLPSIIEALDAYGQQGRFYYLDELAGGSLRVSPEHTWQAVETSAQREPKLVALLDEAMRSNPGSEAWSRYMREVHERIAISVERLWLLIAQCGRNHLFGQTGDLFGSEIHPDSVGRQ